MPRTPRCHSSLSFKDMSHNTLHYDPKTMLTPTNKPTISIDKQKNDGGVIGVTMPIIIDQYGQTPDHYYLAHNPTKPALNRNQVKRRLDLDRAENNTDEFKAPKAKRGRPSSSPKAPVAKPAVVEKTRYDTSLGLLTKKFVDLLKGAQNGIVDLNKASSLLNVQKRRIYDITNVLEGIGLLEKKSKNNIQWRGEHFIGNSGTSPAQLRQSLDDLEAKENQLDKMIHNASLQLKMMVEESENKKYAYVTYRDIRGIKSFNEQTVVAIKAPPDTKLEVPDPKEALQIWLKSERGEIEVYLCPEDDDNSNNSNNQGEKSSTEIDVPSVVSEEAESSDSGDPTLKHAFIFDQDDFAPMEKGFLLQQTEDQHTDSMPFVHLEPPLSEEDYNFALDEGEGIADLFDSYGFQDSDLYGSA